MTIKELKSKIENKIMKDTVQDKKDEVKRYWEENKDKILAWASLTGIIVVSYKVGQGTSYVKGFMKGTETGIKLTCAFLQTMTENSVKA